MERHEIVQPATLDDLEGLSDAELERLVAEGRRKRLEREGVQAVPSVADWRRQGPTLGVVGDLVDGV